MDARFPARRRSVRDCARHAGHALITEAASASAPSYGRGRAQDHGATVDYYSAVSGTFVLQIVGAQQFANTLFFMDRGRGSLQEFAPRRLAVGGACVPVVDQGRHTSLDTPPSPIR